MRATLTTLLSPFDPVLWDRARASVMFGFDDTLECYTPAAKRRFGHLVLPILHRGKLVGPLEAKAHRSEGVFKIRALFLEHGVEADAGLIKAMAAALRKTALWHGAPEILVSATGAAAKGLKSMLRAAG